MDLVNDERLAQFVVASHIRSHPSQTDAELQAQAPDTSAVPQSLLRKYISYARRNVRATLMNLDTDRISQLYVELRRSSSVRSWSCKCRARRESSCGVCAGCV